LAPPALLAVFAFCLSVFPSIQASAPSTYFILGKIQYAYRLVAVINVALLLCLLAALAYWSAVARRPGGPRLALPGFVLGAVVTLCCTGVVVKLLHGKSAIAPHPLPSPSATVAYH